MLRIILAYFANLSIDTTEGPEYNRGMVPVAVGEAQPEGEQAPAGIILRKAFVYRLYPTKKQALALDHQLSEARRLYNAALQERRDAWRNGVSLNYYDQANQLREIRAAGDLGLANYHACQDVLRRVDKAFRAFFRRVKAGQKAGYPRFKARDRFDSFTFPAYGDGARLKEGRLYIQNVGKIKVKLHRPLHGEVKTLTLKQACGKWYAVFSCDLGPAPGLRPGSRAVGIDMGLESFATLSDGRTIPNPRYLDGAARLLAERQRRLSGKVRGSRRRRKARLLVARAHVRVRNQRRDFAHKKARELVRKYDLIAFEDLNISGMVRNHCLAKAISDASWGQFIGILRHKAEEAGVAAIPVDPRGTSQRCSGCGEIVPKDLGDRLHVCPACGLVLHRDLNAARNILALGLSAQGNALRSRLLQLAE